MCRDELGFKALGCLRPLKGRGFRYFRLHGTRKRWAAATPTVFNTCLFQDAAESCQVVYACHMSCNVHSLALPNQQTLVGPRGRTSISVVLGSCTGLRYAGLKPPSPKSERLQLPS